MEHEAFISAASHEASVGILERESHGQSCERGELTLGAEFQKAPRRPKRDN